MKLTLTSKKKKKKKGPGSNRGLSSWFTISSTFNIVLMIEAQSIFPGGYGISVLQMSTCLKWYLSFPQVYRFDFILSVHLKATGLNNEDLMRLQVRNYWRYRTKNTRQVTAFACNNRGASFGLLTILPILLSPVRFVIHETLLLYTSVQNNYFDFP